jgi:hypothetical protein
MMKKKRQLHCGICGSPSEFYKKGRKHRVLICPKHGVIASNPLPLLALASAALPTILEKGSELLGKKTTSPITSQKVITDSLDKPNKGERYVRMVLGD